MLLMKRGYGKIKWIKEQKQDSDSNRWKSKFKKCHNQDEKMERTLTIRVFFLFFW
jgi:hypothetical protein